MRPKLDKVVVQAYFLIEDDEGDIVMPSRPLQPAEIPGKQWKNGWQMDIDRLGEEVLKQVISQLPSEPVPSAPSSNGHTPHLEPVPTIPGE